MAFDLDKFLERELNKRARLTRSLQGTGDAPSKRSNKTKSGRSNVKGYHGRMALAAVGGFRNEADAIFAPADHLMCVVVDSRRGWKTNGDPNRL